MRELTYLEIYKRLNDYCYDPCPKCGKQKVMELYGGRGCSLEDYNIETYLYHCCNCGRLVKRLRNLTSKTNDQYFEITFIGREINENI